MFAVTLINTYLNNRDCFLFFLIVKYEPKESTEDKELLSLSNATMTADCVTAAQEGRNIFFQKLRASVSES